jgi:probable phosphoglycerate mutase
MMRLILARHGETDWNKQHRVQGRSDIELNENGRKQAEALARALRNTPVKAIYTSPLTRARDTASAIGRFHGVDVATLDGLQEIDAGEVDGLTYQEMSSQYGDFFEHWIRDCTSVRPPGGCTLSEVQDQAWGAVQEILTRHRTTAGSQDSEKDTVIAATHFFPILSIVCKAVGLELSECRRLKLDLASITVLDFSTSTTVLTSFNDTCHWREDTQ